MLGDRLSLPVRVRCQKNPLCLLGRILDELDILGLAPDLYVLRDKLAILDLHPQP